jgi:hypothetical protein
MGHNGAPMRRGAVAFMDALGFKGIWKRHPNHRDVLEKLRRLRTAAETAKDEAVKERRIVVAETKRSLATFSDTIFFACSATSLSAAEGSVGNRAEQSVRKAAVEFAGLAVTCAVLAHVIAEAARDPVPLAFRGAIAFGEYSAEEEFVIGPAVDEAAAAHEAADAAIVWLCPSAVEVLQKFQPSDAAIVKLRELERKYLLNECDVPLKQGRSYRTAVVQPFAAVESSKIDASIERTLSTFGSHDVDVAVKKQNTSKFLSWARRSGTV